MPWIENDKKFVAKTWSTNEPITKQAMNDIEQGIEKVGTHAVDGETLATRLRTELGGYSDTDLNKAGTVVQRISSLTGRVTTLENTENSTTVLAGRV